MHKSYKEVVALVSRVKRAYDLYKNPLKVVWKSLFIGLIGGVVVSLYRILLQKMESVSFAIYDFIRPRWLLCVSWFCILILLALLIGWLTKKYTMIGGSGIPQVKGILQGYFKDSWLATLLAKFFGGLVGILAGLSLGREGPSIQLGACVADGFGRISGSTNTERKILIASGASAGLSAAFGAPLSAVMFAVEEIFGYVSPVNLVATTIAAIASQLVSGLIFGLSPVFSFRTSGSMALKDYWILVLLGILVGCAGAFYNSFLICTQRMFDKLPFAKTIFRPVPAFLVAGILGLVFPQVLGGGHAALELVEHKSALYILVIVLVVKFLFSMLSFESGTPGGIFFPLLIMGALIGAIVAIPAITYLGLSEELYDNLIIYAMAGFFTAIVRAPLTGILLLLEMTGSFVLLLPFSIVCITAYLIATLLKSSPIYDSLLERLRESREIHAADSTASSEKVLFEVMVQHGATVEGRMVKELPFPKGSLLISILRGDQELTPGGDTIVVANDRLYVLCELSQEGLLREDFDVITKPLVTQNN